MADRPQEAEWPWRCGLSIGRTIYACPPGSSYRKGEIVIGMLDSAELADHVVALHNWWLDLATSAGRSTLSSIVTALARGIGKARNIGTLWSVPTIRNGLEVEAEQAYHSLLGAGFVVTPLLNDGPEFEETNGLLGRESTLYTPPGTVGMIGWARRFAEPTGVGNAPRRDAIRLRPQHQAQRTRISLRRVWRAYRRDRCWWEHGRMTPEDIAARGLGWDNFEAAPEAAQREIVAILDALRAAGLLAHNDGEA